MGTLREKHQSHVVPYPIVQLVISLREAIMKYGSSKRPKYFSPTGSIMAAILISLKPIEIPYKATLNALRRLQQLQQTYSHLLYQAFPEDYYSQAHKAIEACQGVLSIGSFHAMAVSNLNEIFRRTLEMPIVPSFAHRYEKYCLEKVGKGELGFNTLEQFCRKFQNHLYLYNRPQLLQTVNKSYKSWVDLDDNGQTSLRAILFTARRAAKDVCLIRELVDNIFLCGNLNLPVENPKILHEAIEERIAFPDICVIRDRIIANIDGTVGYRPSLERKRQKEIFLMDDEKFLRLLQYLMAEKRWFSGSDNVGYCT